MTNIHYDLPCGTPDDVSFLEQTRRAIEPSPADRSVARTVPQPERRGEANVGAGCSEPRTSLSDDTISTFSCNGDLLPDESADASALRVTKTDSDYVAMERIAQVLAKRRQVDIDTIMPKLRDLFVVPAGCDSFGMAMNTESMNIESLKDNGE